MLLPYPRAAVAVTALRTRGAGVRQFLLAQRTKPLPEAQKAGGNGNGTAAPGNLLATKSLVAAVAEARLSSVASSAEVSVFALRGVTSFKTTRLSTFLTERHLSVD